VIAVKHSSHFDVAPLPT